MRRAPALVVVVLLCAAASAEPRAAGARDEPTAGGRLIGIASDELDLLGDVWVDVPFRLAARGGVFLAVDSRTSIERAASDLTFRVRDVDYTLQVGWRGRLTASGKRPVSLFLGQRGKQGVDADGQAFVRHLGLGLESAGLRRRDDPRSETCATRLQWRVSGGPVFKQREVEADFVVQGEARLRPARRVRGPLGLVALQVKTDALLHGWHINGDVAGGPAIDLPIAGGRWASFFLHYQHSRNPLGIADSAWLLGFEYAEGVGARRGRAAAPEIHAIVASGGGEDGRLVGQLALDIRSPRFADRWYVNFAVDGNILTARDTGDLYYLWHLGAERPFGRHLGGVYVYHRSNHQLAESNPEVTSLNVLEFGIETADWHRPGAREHRHPWGALDARARVGWLVNSSFGEQHRWHARGGVRWSLPSHAGAWRPFVRVEAEAGDVTRQAYALGSSLSPGWDVQLEFRNDEQYFSRDGNALLLLARYGF